ncbi:MAG: hypothetical protein ABJO67_16030 [Pseudoruegeria sp.]
MPMYSPSDIDKLVHRKINEVFPAERVLCNIGWVSLKNPGIKHRPEYLNAFNFATEIDEIDYISQFIRDANVDTVRDFYRQTNGMRLLCDTFFVPGVLFHRDNFGGHDFFCVALDFSNHGGFALPKRSPENGFLIGGSHRQKDGKTVNLHDILTKSGEIVGGFFDESPEVIDRFSTIPEWLSARIETAAHELRLQISQL